MRIFTQRHNWAIFLRKWARRGHYSLMRIFVQRHNWAIFLRKWGEVVTVNGDCYWPMLNEFLLTKIEEEDIGNIWFQQDGATHYQPQRWCRLATSRCVKDKYYADKPETIDALKDNIREAIGEIQLHTIDNVLMCQPRQPFKWNYFPLLKTPTELFFIFSLLFEISMPGVEPRALV